MAQRFEDWVTELAVAAAQQGPAGWRPQDLSVAPRAWLLEVFTQWDPLPLDDLADVAEIDRERLAPILIDNALALLPAVLADAAACGVTTEVDVTVGESLGLELNVLWAPGRRGAPSGGAQAPLGPAPQVLAWLADGVQEVTMERDQVDCYVWPVCPVHRLGGHAQVCADVAVWWCNGGTGHVLAPIGTLSHPAKRQRRD